MKQVKLDPLTHLDADKKAYQRTAQVEIQIAAALEMERSELPERVRMRDYNAQAYLQEECLVYLVRHFRRNDNDDLTGELLNQLAARVSKHVHGQLLQFLHASYVEECYQGVIHTMTCRLIDLATDKDDFAQVRFWHWLNLLTFNLARPYLKRQKVGNVTSSLDTFTDKDEKEKLFSTADEISTPDLRLLGKETIQILNQLTADVRTAFVLRYYAGWEIENQNPQVRTISNYFNVTPKTIRNWINRAHEELRARLGGRE